MTEPKPNDGFEWTQAAPGRVLQCRPLAAVARHLFTTADVRLRDDRAEWHGVAAAMEVDPAAVRLITQVHGTGIAVVRRGDSVPRERPEADIIISNDPRSAIGVRVADCAPILLAERAGAVVGAAHAGWRGTMQNAATAAVRALNETFGSAPANLVAAIGPSLGPCCGEMGPEVVDQFRASGHDEADIARWFTSGPRGRPHFNLWLANVDQLERAGIPPASIHVSRLCTRCRPDIFHSYRSAGAAAGRMLGAIRPSFTARASIR